MPDYEYLLVGGGMAADSAARGIREEDENGSIGLIGAEPHPPYDRPPLSKGLWQDQTEDEITRGTQQLGVEMHLGTRVVRIDPAAHSVTDDRGATHTYRKLLLATGGAPRRLSGPDDGVIYYRDLADYRQLRQLTGQPSRVLVLGGGYIGAELAASLGAQGHSVHLAFPEETLLARLLPADLGEFLGGYYRDRGVTLHPRRLAAAVRRSGKESRVTFADGGQLTADVVVAGLGIIPGVALAQDAGLTVADGIEVNEFLQTSQPDIYAAGDVASIYSPTLGRRRRVEHEENANLSGMLAGMAMAGHPQPYAHLPMFYSDLFDIGFEGVGVTDSRLEVQADWQEPFRKGALHYLEGGRLVGAIMWNNWGQLDRIRELIEAREPA